ncbi:MAG: serine hydrolase, partial [Ruminococcus sp.]|nr:serine hydrolase [Ruminococcus sp.]
KCLVVLIFMMLLVFSIDESYVESAGSVQDKAAESADAGQNENIKIKKTDLKKVSLKKDELLTIIDNLDTEEKEFYSSSEELLNSKEAKKVKKIQEALYENGSRASFLLVDLNSGKVFSSGTEHIYYGASVLKGPFVVAVNKYDPDSVNDYIKEMMTLAIEMSDNQCYDNLRMTYGVDVLAKLVEDTGASQTVVDAYNWYPDMTVKDLAKLWVGMYWYFFEETNENTEWCISIFENSFQSFISSSLCEEYTVYSKAGWICDEFDIARNDGGIVMDEEDPYILVIMSEAFNDYEKLEELAGALDKVHEKMIQ